MLLHFKRKTDHKRGQYNKYKIGVAYLILTSFSRTSCEITAVQLTNSNSLSWFLVPRAVFFFKKTFVFFIKLFDYESYAPEKLVVVIKCHLNSLQLGPVKYSGFLLKPSRNF